MIFIGDANEMRNQVALLIWAWPLNDIVDDTPLTSICRVLFSLSASALKQKQYSLHLESLQGCRLVFSEMCICGAVFGWGSTFVRMWHFIIPLLLSLVIYVCIRFIFLFIFTLDMRCYFLTNLFFVSRKPSTEIMLTTFTTVTMGRLNERCCMHFKHVYM